MKILLLGGSGFIGRNMYEYFQTFHDVFAPTHMELDILDEQAVKRCLQKERYDIVLNCLDGKSGDKDYLEYRLRMFMNLYKYSQLYGKMIYYGSGAEYDRFRDLVDVSEEMIDEIVPTDTYGFCLYLMNQLTRSSDNIYNLRLFGIYGEHEIWSKRFISNAICKVLYGYPITIRQDRRMDYLYIEDLCKMTEWVMNNIPTRHDYNAVSGKSLYLSDIAKIITNTLNSSVPIYIAKAGKANRYTANANAINCEMKRLDYINMEDSVCRMYQFYKANLRYINREKLLYQ